jgi:hypothetical protein
MNVFIPYNSTCTKSQICGIVQEIYKKTLSLCLSLGRIFLIVPGCCKILAITDLIVNLIDVGRLLLSKRSDVGVHISPIRSRAVKFFFFCGS